MTTEALPVLETGWGPDTPADDSLLRRGMLALAATWEAIGQTNDGRLHRWDEGSAVDLGRPTGLFNGATLLQPVSDDAFGRTVGRIERFYDVQGTGATLLWSPWPTPDLTGRGWVLQGHPPLLYRPPGLPFQPPPPDALTVTEVTTERELAEWCTVAVDAFPLTEVAAPSTLFDRAVLTDERFRFVVGRDRRRAVAVGCQVLVDDTNVLLLSTVRPEYRGRGYYAALVADRLARAPGLPSVTIVSDDSRPVLEGRFGFLPVTRCTLWERPRPAPPDVRSPSPHTGPSETTPRPTPRRRGARP